LSTTAKTVSLLFLLLGCAAAQPVITGGPVNAASYAPLGLPNTGIAQGAMFVVFGRGLGPASILTVNAFPLPTALGGTSIRVTVGGTTVGAIMIYTLARQVAAILPSNAPVGNGTLTITFGNQASAPVPVQVVRSSFGTFSRNEAGSGPAIVQNFISQTDQPLNTLVEAAQPGQVVTLWGTGLSAVAGNESGGPLPGNLDAPVDVFVGNRAANILYRGRSGCCAGVDQIVFEVPAGVEGCYVSVAVRAGGVVGNFTTMSVASRGKVCADPTGLSISDLERAQSGGTMNIGDIALNRFAASFSLPGLGTLEGPVELAEGRFWRYGPRDLLASARGGLGGGVAGAPSIGSCTVSSFNFDDFLDSVYPNTSARSAPRSLDAGPALTVTGPRGTRRLPRQGSASTFFEYSSDGLLGGGIPGLPGLPPPQPTYLDPGSYTLDNGTGGADVGPFRAALTIPSPLIWTNRNDISVIPRSQDLTLIWSGGGDREVVAILGTSATPAAGVGARFICTERAGAGRFTVPAHVVSALPLSGSSEGVPIGFVMLGSTAAETNRFQAPGLDVGFFTYGLLYVKNVVYQ